MISIDSSVDSQNTHLSARVTLSHSPSFCGEPPISARGRSGSNGPNIFCQRGPRRHAVRRRLGGSGCICFQTPDIVELRLCLPCLRLKVLQFLLHNECGRPGCALVFRVPRHVHELLLRRATDGARSGFGAMGLLLGSGEAIANFDVIGAL